MEIAENTTNLTNFIAEKFEAGALNNESLVQIIELCGSYLNLKSIAAYAKANQMSYNGAKNFRSVVNLFGCKFIVDNF